MSVLDLISAIIPVLSGTLSLISSIITIFLKSKSKVNKENSQLIHTIEISLKEIDKMKCANLNQGSNNKK